MKIVEIHWRDSHSDISRWKDIDEYKGQCGESICISAGYEIERKNGHTLLASSISGSYCLPAICIPDSQIVRKRVLNK